MRRRWQARASGVAYPGTFAGLMEKLPYLESLGVNAIELTGVGVQKVLVAVKDLPLLRFVGTVHPAGVLKGLDFAIMTIWYRHI